MDETRIDIIIPAYNAHAHLRNGVAQHCNTNDWRDWLI